MKMITMRQPWAALVANGSKRIETRGYATSYRGPIAIHAAQSTRTWRDLDAPSLVSERVQIDAIYDALDAVLERDPDGSPLSWVSPFIDPDRPSRFIDLTWRGPDDVGGERTRGTFMPLGAVVAVAELVDVLPIVGPAETRTTNPHSFVGDLADMSRPGEVPLPHQRGGLWIIGHNARTHGKPTFVEGERPFGIYEPGRYAWLFDGTRPVDPIPCRGHLGLRDAPTDVVDRVTA